MQPKQPFKKTASPVKSATTGIGRWQLIFLAGAIALVTALTFSPALKNGFINWDDNSYVFENAHLNKPAHEAIGYFFGPHYFVGNYVPVTMITYMLEYKVAGLKPQLFHKVNLVLHLANVLLVFWFIYLLSRRRPLVAALVALFFGIHPMHVESVAWIAELKDVLYSLFFLAGLIAYYRYLEKRSVTKEPRFNAQLVKPLLLSLVLFVLSILSKPAAIVFPLVLLLLDLYTRRRFDRWTWLEKLPFLIISVIFGLIAIQSQQADRLLHDYYGVSQRLLFASHSFIHYLVKLLAPVGLSIFYPYPDVVDGSLPSAFYFAPGALLLLLAGVAYSWRYSRLVAFGFLFFLVNIVLVLQLVTVGEAIMADRYTYIAYIGVFFVMAMGFDQLIRSQQPGLKALRLPLIGLVIACAAGCIYLTNERCKVWRNDETIADDLLEKFPDDRLALNNKGFIFYEQRNYPEAIKLFSKATELKKDYTMAYINLINTYLAVDDMERANSTTDTALKYIHNDHNLLNKKGFLLFKKKKYAQAISYYNKAMIAKRNDINAYINLTEAYFMINQYDAAAKAASTALEYEPHNAILLNNKGYMLYLDHHYKEAIEYFKEALKRSPDYNTAAVNLRDSERALAARNDSLKAGKKPLK